MTIQNSVQQASQVAEGLSKSAGEAAEFGRGNLAAVTHAAQTWTVGMQDLGQQYLASAQFLTGHALEHTKAFAGVTSIKQAGDIQANFARAAVERAMHETAKLQEATLRLGGQVAAPLTERVTLAVETMTRPIAA